MKRYIKPQTVTIEMSIDTAFLTGSGVGSVDKGIGFGGIDYDGSLEPESRRKINIWDAW